MKRKQKQQQNYLDLIPERAPGLDWTRDDEGIVVLEVENTGVFNRLAQKFFKRPKVTKVHMEKYGSFLWPLIDGKRTVMELADLEKAEFGEEVEPLYPRVVKYMQIMESYHFIRLSGGESENGSKV
ncbi:MAG: PqqD family protein [Bacteroidales bacterium]|nr:PqqD family protein [Bacteroidales bacterium]MCM1416978.1 PqqD family protein [bacterium]MCM1424166.1 PqqD family protein [bacterium]